MVRGPVSVFFSQLLPVLSNFLCELVSLLFLFHSLLLQEDSDVWRLFVRSVNLTLKLISGTPSLFENHLTHKVLLSAISKEEDIPLFPTVEFLARLAERRRGGTTPARYGNGLIGG